MAAPPPHRVELGDAEQPSLLCRPLGRIDCPAAWRIQEATRAALLAGSGPPTLLLLEHPPCVTLGRRAGAADLRLPAAALAARGIALHSADRGGLATYHGPGQLVGYPVVALPALRLGVPDFVQRLAEALCGVLAAWGVAARYDPDRPGVYVGQRKIAAIGIHVRQGISTHGFALNVAPDLSAFRFIVPCGDPHGEPTSIAAESPAPPPFGATVRPVAEAVAAALGLRVCYAAGAPPASWGAE